MNHLIMDPMSHGVGNINVGSVLQQVVIYFPVICQGCHAVRFCGCLQWQQMANWGKACCLRLSCSSTCQLFIAY